MTDRPGDRMSLRVSSDGRHLVRASGSPFFWLGDSGWALFARLDLEDSALYLHDRKAKGFSVIQTFYAAGWLPKNCVGEVPILDSDSVRPSPAFLNHVDSVIGIAEDLGMYICLGIAQITKPNSPWRTTDPSVAYGHAREIAARLRRRSNIIRNLGQDNDATDGGVDLRPMTAALAHGVADGVNGEATTAEAAAARRSASLRPSLAEALRTSFGSIRLSARNPCAFLHDTHPLRW